MVGDEKNITVNSSY